MFVCLCVFSVVDKVDTFIRHLTLDKEPDSPEYDPSKKREFYYIISATMAILKRLRPLELAQSASNSRLQLLLPVVVYFCVPLLRFVCIGSICEGYIKCMYM